MRREPALTFDGALKVLNKYEPSMLSRLNLLLGGTILAAGVGTGLATVAGATLAPVAILAPLWGWIDQKNEAIDIIRKVAGGLAKKFDGLAGLERRELIAAAHTTIVAAAFFEGLEDHLGKAALRELSISDHEKLTLVTGGRREAAKSALDGMYLSEVPAPSPAFGFEENSKRIEEWLSELASTTEKFAAGLDAWARVGRPLEPVIALALERYRSHYLALSASVPEFWMWAQSIEHAATRSHAASMASRVQELLRTQGEALSRVEVILDLMAARADESQLDMRTSLWRANRAVLQEPIASGDAEFYDLPITFPLVGRSYIAPKCTVSSMVPQSRPADEEWWDKQGPSAPLDLTLASYFLTPDSTRAPLLLLGHPGAGKSMLTKVLAATLPIADYTVVRVPLRAVGANAPILDQIQQALDRATNKRVEWTRLVEQSSDAVRVVLLDGLDELLQASNVDRSGYLQEVARFQQIEGDQERPLIVVVTSRTVVANRVDIPTGSVIIKLSDFDESEIEQWISRWQDSNAVAIANGSIREMSLQTALSQIDLARQPLLLLMLTIYAADQSAPPLDETLSSTVLYRRLLDNFARREVAKRIGGDRRSEGYERAVESQLTRLSVAALAMFNRGRQHITEVELGEDLISLDEEKDSSIRTPDAGRRLIGEFFFVHAAEATLVGADEYLNSASEQKRRLERSYEFLHATFGEYLVAQLVVDELRDAAASTVGRRGLRDANDDRLFAFLSHQPLATRSSTISYIGELCESLQDEERAACVGVLTAVLESYRNRRRSSKYANYRPTEFDRIRELAAYSANLVLLHLIIRAGGGSLGLSDLLGQQEGFESGWACTVTLWRAGLDADGWQSMLGTLRRAGQSVELSERIDSGSEPGYEYLEYAELIGASDEAERVRTGISLHDGRLFRASSSWSDSMRDWIVPTIVNRHTELHVEPPPEALSPEERRAIADLIEMLLRARDGFYDYVRDLIGILLSLRELNEIDGYTIAISVARNPGLLVDIPKLEDVICLIEPPVAASLILSAVRPNPDSTKNGSSRPKNRAASAAMKRVRRRLASANRGAYWPERLSSQELEDIGLTLQGVRLARNDDGPRNSTRADKEV